MSMTESEREEILSDIREGYIDEWDNLTIDELFKQIESEHKEIQQYRAIGTVSDFRELKEKATAKKVIQHRIDDLTFYICPTCGKANANSRLKTEPKYCKACGQHLDWSEGKE